MGTVIGLDVHKDTIAAACVDASTAQLLNQDTFENTLGGFTGLVHWVDGHHPGRIGLEPSGGVGHAAATNLVEARHAVVLVPPCLSAREARELRSRGKSDPTDALLPATRHRRHQERV